MGAAILDGQRNPSAARPLAWLHGGFGTLPGDNPDTTDREHQGSVRICLQTHPGGSRRLAPAWVDALPTSFGDTTRRKYKHRYHH